MNILILSCNTGEGHNAAGHAVEEAAIARGHNVIFMDAMLLNGQRTSNIVGGAYVGIVKHTPLLFGLIYRLGMMISNRYIKSPVYYANTLLAEKFSKYIEDNNIDAVVMPHLYPAETITYMKKHHMLNAVTVAVGTDYTCIPFWEETDCDYYVIPHEALADEYIKRGVAADRLLPYGIPVKQSFVRRADRTTARRRCHLPDDVNVYLVMNGSMGFGRLVVFAGLFARKCTHDEHIVIICGNNKKLYRVLSRRFSSNKNIHIIGYTHHVSDYMDSCDVIFTKPGGLTSTEALVKNIPIVHTAPIPGCEMKNRDFFCSRGLSLTSRHIQTQIHMGMALAENKRLRNKMLSSQLREAKPDAAANIVKLCERIQNHNRQNSRK